MLSQKTACLGLQKGDHIAYFDEELVFGTLLRSEGAFVAFTGKFFHPAARRLVWTEGENLAGRGRCETTCERLH